LEVDKQMEIKHPMLLISSIQHHKHGAMQHWVKLVIYLLHHQLERLLHLEVVLMVQQSIQLLICWMWQVTFGSL
jgi:hypothetical protein